MTATGYDEEMGRGMEYDLEMGVVEGSMEGI
jgi:hypothetical protein